MRKMIDLTRNLAHGQTGVEFETMYTREKDGWNANTLHLYSHTGTHMDAPFHFGVSDKTIDQIPIERLLVRGHIVSVPADDEKMLINVEHLGDVANKVQPGDAVLLQTRWSRHFDNFSYFRDNLPRISAPLANWLVEKKVGIVGVESHSVADVTDLAEVTLIHEILLGGDIIIVEGLVGLEQIGDRPFSFGAMPLKIAGGDGAPCRAFAMIEE